ncbi:phosphoethanolamine transferase [Providencia alcalifaciens]|uniref:phosphoethanolamine transferase n=1 Tax=Providencia alcalifaciens TaxID=126385 RepID=UPI00131F1320|nr:phosphoethanolamine transferase [Providencia alcalifaciens]
MLVTISLIKNNFFLKILLIFIYFATIHYAMGYYFKPFYVIAITGLAVCLNQYRKWYIVLIIFYAIIASLYFPVGLLYGPPDYNIFSSFYYTNPEEAKGFISNINLKYYLLSALILFFGFIVCRINMTTSKNVKRISVSIFMLIAMIQPVKAFYGNSTKLFLTSGLPEIRFFTESFYYLDYLAKEKKSIEGEPSFGELTINSKYDTYVIVIGESVRRDFMYNYGFPINNTPFMNDVNGIFYNNYISAAGSTNLSLSRSLSMYPVMPNNIITLANKAGFDTFWISRQGQSGKHDGPVASIAKRANDSYFFGGKENISESVISEDGLAIPKFIQILKNPAKKKLIVIHLIGSHSPFCARISNSYEKFYKSKDLSCYVQSIKNTDLLLSEIYSALSKSTGTWSMLYFSDHGLSFIDNQQDLIHGDKKKQNFEVPLFITSSDSIKRETISAQRNGLHLFQLFSEWLGVKETNRKYTCSMLSNTNCNNQNEVIDFDKNTINFNELSDDSIK